MKKQATAKTPDTATGREMAAFIDERELLRRLPVSRRTLWSYRTSGKIPFVRLGGRRVLFHWPTIEAALLRQQRGGGE